MPLTNAGVELIVDALTASAATGFTPFNSTTAYLGVGSSTTAFAKTQTNLITPLSPARKIMDTGFPTQPTATTITLQATWGTSDAVGAWEEWGVFNAASGGTMLSRKVETLGGGPKGGSEAWQLSVTLTIGNP
jgi:hypothetical protein